MLIGVTGASGFLGRAVCNTLILRGYLVRGSVRHFSGIKDPTLNSPNIISVGNVAGDTDWNTFLGASGAEIKHVPDCIIHCAGKAHIMGEAKLFHYRNVNVEGTRHLANMAVNAGVRRFVYVSSIKVNGERTLGTESFSHNDDPKPIDAYGISKWEAENALHEVAMRTGLEVVIVRPPMIYGPGVKGNLLLLLNAVYRGIPLPFKSIDNARSLIGLDNIVDLLINCAIKPSAAGQTFLVSDGKDVSTPDLLRLIGKAMNRSPRLLPIPKSLLLALGLSVGKLNNVSRLVHSLRINSSHVQATLDWAPPVSIDNEMQRMIDWYIARF